MKLQLTYLIGEQYLVTVDYYSKFIEVDRLKDLSTTTTVDVLKSQKLRTDNGSHFVSHKFNIFVDDYQIDHVTLSPKYPTSNGEAERESCPNCKETMAEE